MTLGVGGWGHTHAFTCIDVYVCVNFPGGSVVKTPAAMQRRVRSLGQEDPLEKEMTTHSSTRT